MGRELAGEVIMLDVSYGGGIFGITDYLERKVYRIFVRRRCTREADFPFSSRASRDGMLLR